MVDITEKMEREAGDHHGVFKAQRLKRIGYVAHTMCINKKKRYFGPILRKTRKNIKTY